MAPRPARAGARLWRASPKAAVGLVLMAVFVLLALAAPWLAPGDPSAPTGLPNEAPSAEHLLGTTGQGQDVLAQTLRGSRVTLAVAFAAAAW